VTPEQQEYRRSLRIIRAELAPVRAALPPPAHVPAVARLGMPVLVGRAAIEAAGIERWERREIGDV
jgi:hypothetical protein